MYIMHDSICKVCMFSSQAWMLFRARQLRGLIRISQPEASGVQLLNMWSVYMHTSSVHLKTHIRCVDVSVGARACVRVNGACD